MIGSSISSVNLKKKKKKKKKMKNQFIQEKQRIASYDKQARAKP